jgi:hypothetical protein
MRHRRDHGVPNDMDDAQREGLGIALNEALWLDLEVDPAGQWAIVWLQVATLPNSAVEPESLRVQLVLSPVGRVAASLRHGLWNDEDAPVEAFSLDRLSAVVRSYVELPIYGWEFVDTGREQQQRWSERLSFDMTLAADGHNHTLLLFRDVSPYLEVLIWFDNLDVRRADDTPVEIEEFMEGGRRFWDAVFGREQDVTSQ